MKIARLKKFLAFFMAVAMTLSLSTAAYAAGSAGNAVRAFYDEDGYYTVIAELTEEEFLVALMEAEGVSEEEALEMIDQSKASVPAPCAEDIVEKSVRVTKYKTVNSYATLELSALVRVYKDSLTGTSVSVISASAANVAVSGSITAYSYSGGKTLSYTTSSVTLDYNGEVYFTLNPGISVSAGVVGGSVSTGLQIKQTVYGTVTWSLSQI